MRDRDYYPAGAYDDPNAPYNEVSVPEEDFDVVISQTLSKTTTVTTDSYNPYFDEEDGHVYADTENTNWSEEYSRNDHYTPLELIELFKKHLEAELAKAEDAREKEKLQDLIDECSGWEEDDIEIFEDK